MIAAHSECVHARRYRGARIDRLLVEDSRCHTALEKTSRSDRCEVSISRPLNRHQPYQRTDAGRHHRFVSGPCSGGDQCLRQARVAVRDAVLAPRPIGLIRLAEEMNETVSDRASRCLNMWIAIECMQVLIDAQQCERPSARTVAAPH